MKKVCGRGCRGSSREGGRGDVRFTRTNSQIGQWCPGLWHTPLLLWSNHLFLTPHSWRSRWSTSSLITSSLITSYLITSYLITSSLVTLLTRTWCLLWLTNVTWFTTHDLRVVTLSRSLFFLFRLFCSSSDWTNWNRCPDDGNRCPTQEMNVSMSEDSRSKRSLVSWLCVWLGLQGTLWYNRNPIQSGIIVMIMTLWLDSIVLIDTISGRTGTVGGRTGTVDD